MVCAETFRFTPEGTGAAGDAGVSVVAGDVDAFSARLGPEPDAEETEEKRTAEWVPRAVPPAAATREAEARAARFSPSGVPAPPPRISMGGVVDDDSSLISVLLPPASAASKTVGSYDAPSKLFVVTHSRRREEYVTYACGASE